jgi:tetratricopeptide (TPR) repeat protein
MDNQDMPVRKSFLERFGTIIFIAFTFLLPLFIIPSSSVPFQEGKALLVFVAAFALFIIWVFTALKRGKLLIPRSLIMAALGVLVIVYFLSALFSPSILSGIVGRGFELDTALSILSFALLLFLVPQIFRTKQSIFNFYLALFASFAVVLIFGFIRLVAGPGVLTLGVLTSSASNLVGSWNDLGVFFGLITVLSLVMLEIVPPKGILRVSLYSALVLSLIALAIVNFDMVWYVLGGFSLALLAYLFAFARSFGSGGVSNEKSWKEFWRLPKSPFIVLLVSLVFIITGNQAISGNHPSLNIGNKISERLNIVQLEARPSWSTTVGITKNSLKTSLLLGGGPNQFVYQWYKYRPRVVNESAFWNVDFNFGIGIISSAFVSTGVLGGVAWLLLLALFVYQGVKALRRPREDLFAYYLSVTSFVGALYLWMMAIFYTTSTVPFALAFIMTGAFVATLVLQDSIQEKTISFGGEPSFRFIALVTSIILIIFTAGAGIVVAQKNIAYAYFNKALAVYNGSGNLASAETYVRRAISISGEDSFYRGLSQIALINLNQVATQVTPQTPPDQIRTRFQALLGGAIQAAQVARDANQENFQNWISLGQTYESVVPLKIAGAYENAKASYLEAEKRNPTSPEIRLTLARLEALNNSNKAAKDYITEALTLKSNYTDAIFLLSQIEVAEGNLGDAIKSVESAAVLAPNDPTVFFQLGFLYYNNKDYQKAIITLERAVGLQSSYANARYFLGLSYDKQGRNKDAISQFESIQATNPDNQEVKFILSNLRAGKDAFASVKPPLDNKPEKRKTPPIPDQSQSNI